MDPIKKDFIESTLKEIYRTIGIDQPSNHDSILEFIIEDVESAADEDFHDGDIAIAFRRYLEKDAKS